MARNITEWQSEFYSGPKVWCTWYRYDGIEELGNIYESKEAAEVEVDWCRKRSKRNVPTIAAVNIHSLKLSKERWTKSNR